MRNIHELVPLAQEIYDDNPVGCCLHIVLDDGNVGDSHVKFCIEEAKKMNHPKCLELANKLLNCSKTQRLKLINLID